MAEDIWFNLTKEFEKDLLHIYQSLCDNLAQKLDSLERELEKLCSQTQYEPMLNIVNETVDLFNDDTYSMADEAFGAWSDGQYSFSANAKMLVLGDVAIETAQQIEQSIKGLFEGFWSSRPLGKGINLDTSSPRIKQSDFDELKDIYTRFSLEVEDINEKIINQIKEQGYDDPTYNVVIPAIIAITKPINRWFEKAINSLSVPEKFGLDTRTAIREMDLDWQLDNPAIALEGYYEATKVFVEKNHNNKMLDEERSAREKELESKRAELKSAQSKLSDMGENSFEKLHEFVKSVAAIIRNNAEENSTGSNVDSTGTTSEPTSGTTGESAPGTTGEATPGNDSNQVEPESEHGDREEGAEPQKEEETEENSDKKKKNNWLKVAKDLFLKFGPPTMRVIASGLPDIVNADPVLAISPFGRASEGIAKMLNTLADEIDKSKGDNKDDKSDAPDTDSEKKNAAIQLAMGALNAMGIPTDIKDDKETESFMKDHKQEMTEGLLGWLLGDDPDMVRLFGVLGYDIGEIRKDAQEDKKDGSTGDTITMDYPVKILEGDKNVSKGNNIKQENNGKGNVPGGTDRRAYIDTISDVTSMLGETDPALANAICKAAPNIIHGIENGNPQMKEFGEKLKYMVSASKKDKAARLDMPKQIAGTIMGNDDYRRIAGIDGDTARKSKLCKEYRNEHNTPEVDYPERPTIYKDEKEKTLLAGNADARRMRSGKKLLGQACASNADSYDVNKLRREAGDLARHQEENALRGYVELPQDSQFSKMANNISRRADENGLPKMFTNKEGKHNAHEMDLLRDEVERELSGTDKPDLSRVVNNSIRRNCGYPRINDENKIIIEEIRELIPVLDDDETEFIVRKNDINTLIMALYEFNGRDNAQEEKEKVIEEIEKQSKGNGLLDVAFSLIFFIPMMFVSLLDMGGDYAEYQGSGDRGINAYQYFVSEIGVNRTEKLLSEYSYNDGTFRRK